MSKEAKAAESPVEQPQPRNVAVEVIANATKIGNAIVAQGPCDFPLTMTQAKALESLGKVRITGIF